MGNNKFQLLIPSSWLHKLKENRSKAESSSSSRLPRNSAVAAAAAAAAEAARTTPSARSKQRAENLPCSPVNTKASDTHFPPLNLPQKRRRRRRAAANPCVAIASSASCNLSPAPTSRKPPGSDVDLLPEEEIEEDESGAVGREAAPGGDSGDLVVIKCASANPTADFAESMVEMIVENGIRDARGLEELLACYLSLNSEEHHEIIVEVFGRIWFALADAELL